MTDISSRALVVNLTISQWSGRKLDKKVTHEAVAANDAAEDSGRFNKLLLPKEALAPIQTIASAARLYTYTQTLPWGDNGDRVLMSSNYYKFMERMREYTVEFNAAVNTLVDKYGEFVDRARFRLNAMFNASDYPSVDDIRGKFSMRYMIRPVPVANDFRVAMGGDEVEEIKAQINKDNERILQEAMRTVWEEVGTTMLHLRDKLADPKGIFKESTISNLEDLAERIPHLNLTDDPKLERFRKELKERLIGYSAKELRKDKQVRRLAAIETQQLVDAYAGMWG